MRMDVLWRGLLVEGQADAFIEMLSRSDSPLNLERSTRLAQTLSEVILNRPTQRSRPSEPGPRQTDGTSKAASSSRATRSKKRAS